MFARMKLRTRLMSIGILLTAVPLFVFLIIVVQQNSRMAKTASEGTKKMADADLDHMLQGFYGMCQARNNAVQEHVNAGLKVTRNLVKNTGKVSFSGETVTWNVINQYTKASSSVTLPKMMVGDTWLGKNADINTTSPVVDVAKDNIGGTCTIFQRMNEAGDMLRVSTNVVKKDGTRAIGTYIPAVNPDGKSNPVISTILSGNTFKGRAFVVDDWYITAYEPIYGVGNKVVGVLYVGFSQEGDKGIRQAMMDTVIGKTGYVFVLDNKGHYVISKGGKRDGENIWKAKDADGTLFIQEMCNKSLASSPGEIVEERYSWKNQGESTARYKIAHLLYFRPWGWVIGAGAYENEVFEAGNRVAEMGRHGNIILTSVFVVALLGAVLVWFFVARGLAGVISRTVEHLTDTSDQVASASTEVSSASQSLAEGASEQAASLEESSSSLEEMASMIKQNADNSHEANTLMANCSKVVDGANSSMIQLTGSMEDITKASEETSKIVKTIDEIAFQTNLLALNAAVEAARAGEAGAGFAVVAEEVRNLAIRSAEAAKNTTVLIEDTVRKVKDGSDLVSKSDQAFSTLADEAKKVGELISEIAGASKEQAQGIDQVSKGVAEMDKVTQQNAANSEESASAAEELNAQAEMMKQMVGELRDLVGDNRSM